MPDPAFPTRNDPVNTLEIEFLHRPEEGFGTDEANRSRDPA